MKKQKEAALELAAKLTEIKRTGGDSEMKRVAVLAFLQGVKFTAELDALAAGNVAGSVGI